MAKCRPVKALLYECIDTAVIFVVVSANAFIGNARGQLPQSRYHRDTIQSLAEYRNVNKSKTFARKQPQHVVIVGGGFAGLFTTQSLRCKHVRVTLIGPGIFTYSNRYSIKSPPVDFHRLILLRRFAGCRAASVTSVWYAVM